jgi:cytochrome c oxidase cbb3-type subunit 4
MYKHVLQSIEGIAVYPIISLTIFFIFFVLLLYMVYSYDKGWLDAMANKPLEDGSNGDSVNHRNSGEDLNG